MIITSSLLGEHEEILFILLGATILGAIVSLSELMIFVFKHS